MSRSLIPILILAAGCGGKVECGPGTKDVDGVCVIKSSAADDTGADADDDRDGDGVPRGTDCDDDNSSVYPGADELCDGVDNDCDGRVDEEDAINPGTFFKDADGDGFGDPSISEEACTAPDGMVEEGTDCDDTNPGAFPGATEVWYDGVDSDCAGDGDFDRDGDGFPGGADGTDCNDEEALAYPLAEEVCGDGIDNNCDGYLGDCGLTGEISTERSAARLLGHTHDVAAGTSVALVGDVDGDGSSMALIGAPRLDTAEHLNAGGAFLVDANASGVVDLSTGLLISGQRAGGQAGSHVQRINDINMDGYNDFLVADLTGPGPSTEIEVVVVGDTGSPDTGMETPPTDTGTTDTGSTDTGSTVVEPPEPPEDETVLVVVPGEPEAGVLHMFRGPIASDMGIDSSNGAFRGIVPHHGVGAATILGDQDGDGTMELAFGISADTDRGPDSGTVLLVAGPWVGEINAESSGHRLSAAGPEDAAGHAVIAPGDLNGDGFDDLVISATMAESAAPSPFSGVEDVYVNAGAVYVLNGPIIRDLFLDDADGIHVGEHDDAHAGSTLASGGDLNGDGLPDIIIGAPDFDYEMPDVGAAYVIHGPGTYSGSLSDAHARLLGTDGAGRAGISIAAAGDTDGDGTREFLVGADRANGGAGIVYLIPGNTTGTMNLHDATTKFIGANSGDWFGHSISSDQDINADGLNDILIGAPGDDTAGDNAGAAFIFFGERR